MASMTRKIPLNKSQGTRNACIAGLILAWIIGTGLIAGGAYLSKHGQPIIPISRTSQELLPILLNVIITLLNEPLGFIHAVSLRWALRRETRLAFNSNLRLLTSSKTSWPNAWYSNIFILACLITTYASASLIFIGDDHPFVTVNVSYIDPTSLEGTSFISTTHQPKVRLWAVAMIPLGCGLLGQSIMASFCLRHNRIHSWSSSPIETTAACLNQGFLRREEGRCMRSVHDTEEPSTPASPRCKQASAYRAYKGVRYVTKLLWLLVLFGAIWAGVIFALIKSNAVNGAILGSSWSFLPVFTSNNSPSASIVTNGTSSLNIGWGVDAIAGKSGIAADSSLSISNYIFLWAFFLIAGIQTPLTLTLHCSELLVNFHRDEFVWRSAMTKGGLNTSYNSVTAPLRSWPYPILLIMKAAVHWMYGLSLSVYFSEGVVMRPTQIVYMTLLALFLAVFVTYISISSPKGPQPATFGHLQTLANLVDEWSEIMYWGHKYYDSRTVAHAGTSPEPLETVRLDLLYLGGIESSGTPPKGNGECLGLH
ncbi:hypothetical protein TWF694_001346 [Orbilia ellipsospora]|uniref:Uncharacterized protein n=1 Tax=Orbilia ellipsospora TaxID=2528407 RepID=A0AAV9XRI7_9PEZI